MRRAEKVETEQVYLMQLAALTLKNVVGEGGGEMFQHVLNV